MNILSFSGGEDSAALEIKITCNGNRTISLDEFEDFQGSLKTLSDVNFNKLKNLIIKRGFSFPVFVWNKNKILDGHQRLAVVKWLIDNEDYTLAGDIPVCDIEADTKQEAAEKLLELQGRYGTITEEGLSGFLDEFDIDIGELAGDLELPDLDIDEFLKDLGGDDGKNADAAGEDTIDEKYMVVIECSGEAQQVELLEKFQAEGLICKALIS